MDGVVYIHGKGGCAEEAEHYRKLFPSCDVIGLDYRSSTPWDAGKELNEAIAELSARYGRIILIANSIGAYFSMNAGIEEYVSHAYFVSPIVDMEKLIMDMLVCAGTTEHDLRDRGIISTDFGEDLSWEYLCYVRKHTISWNVPTDILYGSGDSLTSIETISAFARKHHANITVMEKGEHWFHTDEQMLFLDEWIRNRVDD